jgi:hypothetical protein
MRKRIFTIGSIVVMIATGIFVYALVTSPRPTTSPNTNTNVAACTAESVAGAAVTYTGREGVNAYERLIETGHTVGKAPSGLINEIDGVKPDDQHFWGFYVNCAFAQVGAEQYTTKDSDIIHWKIETIEPS